ncbi:DNA-3-methyladenine glycosylase family protein [Xenorhabdus doucetiae]|uniref:DNA-3-methyladenine glycosylase II n=1 Tax=Xenorhabdus doucetiae TaxID=351671 RepID=A0A068QTZ6_9GAMM|nr:DNA-3-methyladenine glycosylase 2 [Xenorhabdus doucetiae]TYP10467.1 DNA-3-methyladenine glycosylase II [Xenorhabdus doucetiae]CDG18502.1 Similarities with the C-terminal region of 3-methyladenine DNA glycosylase [Xenorhabdus doucetiae]
MNTSCLTEIILPNNYHTRDFLAFHQRDGLGVAEIVQQNQIKKGIIWQENPALLTITIGKNRAKIQLDIDGDNVCASPHEALSALASHMLGLKQPVDIFESCYQDHPVIGELVSRQTGLRIYQSATPFEALSWAIIGQQISLSAAISIRRRFIQAVGIPHSSGLLCHPNNKQVRQCSQHDLRQCGFSVGKANALLQVCQRIDSGELVLNIPASEDKVKLLTDSLLAIKGIGMWTVNYALLRGFNYLDGSLHGDVAVRRNLQYLLNQEDKVSAEQAEKWLADFAPWKALVGAHLWRQQSRSGY